MADPTQAITPNFTGGGATPRLQQPAPADPQAVQLHRLRKAASEFESLFLAQLLKTMQATVPKADQSKSLGGDVMLDVASEKLAEDLSKRGGIGLADIIFESMKDRIVADSSGAATADRSIPRETDREFRPLGNAATVNKEN